MNKIRLFRFDVSHKGNNALYGTVLDNKEYPGWCVFLLITCGGLILGWLA
jgi:hypothetical protein